MSCLIQIQWHELCQKINGVVYFFNFLFIGLFIGPRPIRVVSCREISFGFVDVLLGSIVRQFQNP